MIRPFIFSVFVLLLSGVLASQVFAQQIILDDIAVPKEPEIGRPDIVAPILPMVETHQHDRGDAAAPVPSDTRTLVPLRARRPQVTHSEYHRMQGQFDRAEFMLFMPRDVGAATLKLTTRSAINILPERSRIEVYVNDTSVGMLIPDHFDADRADEIDVPDGLFVPGPNRVTLVARQVHRVFCGPEAAFSLWTDLALSASGVEVTLDQFSLDAHGFLSATAAQLARSEPYSIRISGADFSLTDAASLIARVQDVFGGTPPRIEFEDYYSVSPTLPQFARATALPPDHVLLAGPEFRRGGDGAVVLLVNSGQYSEVEGLLSRALDAVGMDDAPPKVVPGTFTTLASLGEALIDGQGRYFRAEIPFRLPHDWLLLASQKATLNLDYRFDNQLPAGALLLVKINGQTIRLLPMDEEDQAGRPLPTLRIPFAANLLKPGVNRLDFEALVPGNPPNRACELRENPIFQILGTTGIYVPPSPAMSLPSIDKVLDELGTDDIQMSDAARATIAIGMLPQLSAVYVSASSPDEIEPRPNNFDLTVGVVSDLSALTGDVVAENLTDLQSVLLTTTDRAQPQLDPWSNVDTRSWFNLTVDADRSTGVPGLVLRGLEAMWHGPEPALADWLEGRAADAILLQPDMKNPGDVWLILRSKMDPAPVIASLSVAHREFDSPYGQVSIFSSDTGWSSWNSPDRPLHLHQPLTPWNISAVVGNYVTIKPKRYVIALLLLTLCSAVVAMGIIITTRRRPK